MIISLYSFLMAVFWFSAMIVLATFLQRRTGVILLCRPAPLLILLGLTLFRLAVPIELPFTQVATSTAVYPAVQALLQKSWALPGGAAVSGLRFLLWVWFLAALFPLTRLGLQLSHDHRTVKNLLISPCCPAEQCLDRLRATHARAQTVQLLVSPQIAVPTLAGFRRPVILLPQSCAELSRQELEFILSHELTHLSRGDLWVKLLIRIVCCLMWWNPCVYLLRKDLDGLLEFQCDLTVTKPMDENERIHYLETILFFLKRLSTEALGSSPQACFCGISLKPALYQRFQLVLDQPRRRRLPQYAVVSTFLALFLLSYSLVLQPASYPPPGDLAGMIEISPETSYIAASPDGTYRLVYEGGTMGTLSSNDLDDDPYCFLTVVPINEGELT